MSKYYVDIETIESNEGTITIVRQIVDVEPRKREIDLSMWTIEERQPLRCGNPESFMEDMLELQELIEKEDKDRGVS